MSDDTEDARKRLAEENRLGTLSREETEAMMKDSYARRSKRDRARNALREALGRGPIEEKVKKVMR